MGSMTNNNFMMDWLKNLNYELSEEYIKSSTVTAIIIGVIAAAMIIAAAFLMNKNKGLGIAAGVLQLAGCFCVQKAAHIFSGMELVRFEYITGSSQAELDKKTEEFYANYMSDLFGDLIPYMLCSLVFMAGWIMTLVFIIKCMSAKPKILPVFALVLQIGKYLFIPPMPMYKAMFGKITEEMQKSSDLVNYVAVLLPLLLILIPAILARVQMSKTPVAVPADAEAAEEIDVLAVQETEEVAADADSSTEA